MPTAAPLYHPPLPRQFSTAQKQKRADRKRKHDSDDRGSSNESDKADDGENAWNNTRIESPVDGVAQGQLDGSLASSPNFATSAKSRLAGDFEPTAIDDLVLGEAASIQKASSKARHLNNIMAILHRCILEGDWVRTRRVWGVLVRIEIHGSGLDLRRNGIWMIGAEAIMRKDCGIDGNPSSDLTLQREHGEPVSTSTISDLGLKLAREYYERLVLQFPYTQRAQHALLNAKVIYPALFNAWIFEVQRRFTREKRQLEPSEAARIVTPAVKQMTDGFDSVNGSIHISSVIGEEIAEATRILSRLDELLSNPPYDTCLPLLRVRESTRLWVKDLHEELHPPKD